MIMKVRGQAEEDALVAKFISMREHLRPLASVFDFPALTDFKLCGLRITIESEQLRPRLLEMANSALVDLVARDIRVSVLLD